MPNLAQTSQGDLSEALWASVVVAALVSGVVSLVTAWMAARLQARRDESAWQRSAQVDVYVAALDGFQQVVSIAMRLALDIFVLKISNATAQEHPAEEPENIDGLRSKLAEAEEAFVAARSRAVVVGSPEIVQALDQMSNVVFEVGGSARDGSDTASDEWHEWREQARTLRLVFANEARKSLGFESLRDWPSFEAIEKE